LKEYRMKIIALVPFKNEEWILPTYLSNVLPIVDEIIGIDDGSTDNSKKIMEDAGVRLVDYDKKEKLKAGWYEWSIREELLRHGRESNGTHFVCLDADETFTSTFLLHGRDIISSLKPGEKLAMQWLALWKSYTEYRDDSSVWSNNWKDFVVCDDTSSGFDYGYIGVGRTNGTNNGTWKRLDPQSGAVLHYQFSLYNNFQLKQCLYRIQELIHRGVDAWSSINQKYSITLLEDNVGLRKMPESWTHGIPLPNYPNFDPEWKEENYARDFMLPEAMQHFDNYGVEYFENLEIWHIPQLRDRFIMDTGRNPK